MPQGFKKLEFFSFLFLWFWHWFFRPPRKLVLDSLWCKRLKSVALLL
jgi:hypothetical protein